MTKLASSILEIIRMMIMMMIVTAVLGSIEHQILKSWISWEESYFLFLFAGNVCWFLVLYRNRLQFSGWYRSAETQRKLSRNATRTIVAFGALLIAAPVILTWITA
ncbi:hypothetical protein SAMN04488688_101514 [Paenibacillus sp. cl141a]|uniref:hypothetical protein n=1 Tax=Paenibacillus sp. cl141a TaxID=1761877 RepID=UPI0008B19BA3|nr:hypothetical protein [Paenibacillus sp. cl141a]SEK34296.1 hypothetical protein SAMN04488688_101514 [Paenibacillus sp. cl141a]